jgi:hypothetical protein
MEKRGCSVLPALLAWLCVWWAAGAAAETIKILGGQTLELIQDLALNEKTRFTFNFDDDTDNKASLSIKNPANDEIYTFRHERSGTCHFAARHAGDYSFLASNYNQAPVILTFEFSEKAKDGAPIGADSEVDPVHEFETELKNIITSQQSLLIRLNKRLETNKSIRSGIKKLAIVEVLSCFFVLYYLQSDIFKTFYNKRRF